MDIKIELVSNSVKQMILMSFYNNIEKEETFQNVQNMFKEVVQEISTNENLQVEDVELVVLEHIGKLGSEEYIREVINTIYKDGFIK